jgi:hypothetical protein
MPDQPAPTDKDELVARFNVRGLVLRNSKTCATIPVSFGVVRLTYSVPTASRSTNSCNTSHAIGAIVVS